MGLGGWLKRRAEEKAVRVAASKYDTPEEVQAALEAEMSDSTRAWLHGLVAAAIGGAVGVVSVALSDPQKIEALFTIAGVATLWKSAVAGAILGVVALLKQSPLPPKLILFALMFLPSAVRADEPPVRMTFGALGSFTVSDAGAKTTPGAFIRVESPLVLGTSAPLRLFAQADILGLPGATQGPDLTTLETFSAARGTAGLLRDVGALVAGGQDLRTALVLHGAFATRIGTDPAPLDRYARSYGIGLQFEERVSGAYLRLEIGHDDAVAEELGRGHLLVSASIPIPHSAGVASLGADAALSLGHPEGVVAHDRVTFSLRVSPPKPAPPPPAAVAAPVSTPKPEAPPASPAAPQPSTPTDPWAPELSPGPINVHR